MALRLLTVALGLDMATPCEHEVVVPSPVLGEASPNGVDPLAFTALDPNDATPSVPWASTLTEVVPIKEVVRPT